MFKSQHSSSTVKCVRPQRIKLTPLILFAFPFLHSSVRNTTHRDESLGVTAIIKDIFQSRLQKTRLGPAHPRTIHPHPGYAKDQPTTSLVNVNI